MASIASARALFLAEAGRLLAAEEESIRLLSELVERAEDPGLRRDLRDHARRSYHHVERISDVLHDLAEVEETDPSPGLDGLASELRATLSLVEESAELEVGDLVLIAGALRIEAYEIASYEGLLPLAKALAPDAFSGLAENLADERLAADALEEHAGRMAARIEGGIAEAPR
jgi:ferritin-like metal-binding protein YciE